jgi:hypothetical protein
VNITIRLSILAVLSLLCWLSCCGGRIESRSCRRPSRAKKR